MSGKMDWDRVRKETLARSHGSEWVRTGSRALKPKRKKKTKIRRKSVVGQARRMPGCTCGKMVGFKGEHKKRCPLRRPQELNAPRRIESILPSPSTGTVPAVVNKTSMKLSQFAKALKGVRKGGALRNFLSALLKMIANDKLSSNERKHTAERSIAAMLDELAEFPCQRGSK